MNITEPKWFIAPNDETIVKIYPHGFIEPVTEISQEQGELIGEMASVAAEKLGGQDNTTPFAVFELMGWKELPASIVETMKEFTP